MRRDEYEEVEDNEDDIAKNVAAIDEVHYHLNILHGRRLCELEDGVVKKVSIEIDLYHKYGQEDVDKAVTSFRDTLSKMRPIIPGQK